MSDPREQLLEYVQEKIESEEFDDFANVQGDDHERMILRSVIGELLDSPRFQMLCTQSFTPLAKWHRLNIEQPVSKVPNQQYTELVAVSDGFKVGMAQWHVPSWSWAHKTSQVDFSIIFWSYLPAFETTDQEKHAEDAKAPLLLKSDARALQDARWLINIASKAMNHSSTTFDAKVRRSIPMITDMINRIRRVK